MTLMVCAIIGLTFAILGRFQSNQAESVNRYERAGSICSIIGLIENGMALVSVLLILPLILNLGSLISGTPDITYTYYY